MEKKIDSGFVAEWLRSHLMRTALTAASVLIMVKTVVPGIFDFIIDLAFLGIIAGVGHLAKK